MHPQTHLDKHRKKIQKKKAKNDTGWEEICSGGVGGGVLNWVPFLPPPSAPRLVISQCENRQAILGTSFTRLCRCPIKSSTCEEVNNVCRAALCGTLGSAGRGQPTQDWKIWRTTFKWACGRGERGFRNRWSVSTKYFAGVVWRVHGEDQVGQHFHKVDPELLRVVCPLMLVFAGAVWKQL